MSGRLSCQSLIKPTRHWRSVCPRLLIQLVAQLYDLYIDHWLFVLIIPSTERLGTAMYYCSYNIVTVIMINISRLTMMMMMTCATPGWAPTLPAPEQGGLPVQADVPMLAICCTPDNNLMSILIFYHFRPFSAPNNNGFRIHWNIQTDFILKWQSSWTRRWETMHHQKRITRPLSAYLSSFICYARFMLGNR